MFKKFEKISNVTLKSKIITTDLTCHECIMCICSIGTWDFIKCVNCTIIRPSLVYCLFPVMACIDFEDPYLFKEKSCALAIFMRNYILRVIVLVIMKGILNNYLIHFTLIHQHNSNDHLPNISVFAAHGMGNK